MHHPSTTPYNMTPPLKGSTPGTARFSCTAPPLLRANMSTPFPFPSPSLHLLPRPAYLRGPPLLPEHLTTFDRLSFEAIHLVRGFPSPGAIP